MQFNVVVVDMWDKYWAMALRSCGGRTGSCWQRLSRSAGDRARRLRLARMIEERQDPVIFGLIGMPMAWIGKKFKLSHYVFVTELSVRSIASAGASATGIWQDLDIRIRM